VVQSRLALLSKVINGTNRIAKSQTFGPVAHCKRDGRKEGKEEIANCPISRFCETAGASIGTGGTLVVYPKSGLPLTAREERALSLILSAS
jgi:hypothetical protein